MGQMALNMGVAMVSLILLAVDSKRDLMYFVMFSMFAAGITTSYRKCQEYVYVK